MNYEKNDSKSIMLGMIFLIFSIGFLSLVSAVYTGEDGCPPQNISFCGDGVINQANESCDYGEMNGVVCNAEYNSYCEYCSDTCEIKSVRGEYCGDGIVNRLYEKCDDGNQITWDGCTPECRKTIDITTEDFKPQVWMCDSRVVLDDNVQWGRISQGGQEISERTKNYAFEGEQIQWKILVLDKNGIEKVREVFVALDDGIEANCHLDEVLSANTRINPACNARIGEEKIDVIEYDNVAAYYTCILSVETTESMYGEHFVTIEADDLDGLYGIADEVEYWFLNPIIALTIDGDLMFDNIRPGTSSYSRPVLVGNDADYGSGVMLDMFISGTDFYDSSSSGALCGTSNQLELKNFRYYATNGAYSTATDAQRDDDVEGIYDIATVRNKDPEGYVNIQYGNHWDRSMYYEAEIIQAGFEPGPPGQIPTGYYRGNLLSPGSEMSLIFRLDLPEPCNGDFDTGQIYFWGEAV
jgi:cysteine-rich repeat protein